MNKRLNAILGSEPDSVEKINGLTIAYMGTSEIYLHGFKKLFSTTSTSITCLCEQNTPKGRIAFSTAISKLSGTDILLRYPRNSLRRLYGRFDLYDRNESRSFEHLWLPGLIINIAPRTHELFADYSQVPQLHIWALRSFCDTIDGADLDSVLPLSRLSRLLYTVDVYHLREAVPLSCPYCLAKLRHPLHTVYHTMTATISPEMEAFLGIHPDTQTPTRKPYSELLQQPRCLHQLKKLLRGDWSKVF